MYHSQLELLKHILDECNFLVEKSEGLIEDEFYENEIYKKGFVEILIENNSK